MENWLKSAKEHAYLLIDTSLIFKSNYQKLGVADKFIINTFIEKEIKRFEFAGINPQEEEKRASISYFPAKEYLEAYL